MLIRRDASLKAGSIVRQEDLAEEVIPLKVVIQLVERQKLNAIKSKVRCIRRRAQSEYLGRNLKRNNVNVKPSSLN
jgi:hypothetical protein